MSRKVPGNPKPRSEPQAVACGPAPSRATALSGSRLRARALASERSGTNGRCGGLACHGRSRLSSLLSHTLVDDPLGADVELNRNFTGLTPRAKEVIAGEYEVKLRKKGFEEWVKTLTVEPGQTATIHAELRTPGQGSLD